MGHTHIAHSFIFAERKKIAKIMGDCVWEREESCWGESDDEWWDYKKKEPNGEGDVNHQSLTPPSNFLSLSNNPPRPTFTLSFFFRVNDWAEGRIIHILSFYLFPPLFSSPDASLGPKERGK